MQLVPFTESLFDAHEAAFLAIARDVQGEYWAREHFLRDLPEKWQLSFAVMIDDEPVGYAIMSRPEAGRVHLHHLMLRADKRGQGIGQRMLMQCRSHAQAAGARTLSLKVAAGADRARRLYCAHGFRELSIADGYVSGVLTLDTP